MNADQMAALIAAAMEGDYPEGSVATFVTGDEIRVDLIDNEDDEHAFVVTVEKRRP